MIDINTRDNVITAGAKEELERKRLLADDVNMLSSASAGEARAKVRYRQKEEACAYAVKGGLLEVLFHEPVSSVTPGAVRRALRRNQGARRGDHKGSKGGLAPPQAPDVDST